MRQSRITEHALARVNAASPSRNEYYHSKYIAEWMRTRGRLSLSLSLSRWGRLRRAGKTVHTHTSCRTATSISRPCVIFICFMLHSYTQRTRAHHRKIEYSFVIREVDYRRLCVQCHTLVRMCVYIYIL